MGSKTRTGFGKYCRAAGPRAYCVPICWPPVELSQRVIGSTLGHPDCHGGIGDDDLHLIRHTLKQWTGHRPHVAGRVVWRREVDVLPEQYGNLHLLIDRSSMLSIKTNVGCLAEMAT